MRAERLRVDRDVTPERLAEAAAILRRGGLVAFPTETVYGLGAHALEEAAVARIFAAKGRPHGDPLIVHVRSAEEVTGVAASLPAAFPMLARTFWPGPLTLILPRGARVPLAVTAGRETVAVRVPSHPVARALLAAAAVPIAAPSANRFSRPSPTTADHVMADLGDSIDMVIDAGPAEHGVESTVLDLTGGAPVVRRPGAVTIEALSAVVPDVVWRGHEAGDAAVSQVSPGTLLKHYSPRAAVRLWTGTAQDARRAMRADAAQLVAARRRVGALVVDEDRPSFDGLPVTIASLGAAARLEDAASRLFDGLRALDAAGVDVILARDPGRGGLGTTIFDRLFRAAEGRVLDSPQG